MKKHHDKESTNMSSTLLVFTKIQHRFFTSSLQGYQAPKHKITKYIKDRQSVIGSISHFLRHDVSFKVLGCEEEHSRHNKLRIAQG